MSQTPDRQPRPDDDTALDRMLADPAAAGVEDPRLRALVEALRAPGTPKELAGEDAAVSMFAAEHATVPPHRDRRRRTHYASRRLAVAAVVLAAGIGASAAAAYTGSLPDPVQRFAHRVIAAPEPEPDSAAPRTPAPGGRSAPDTTASASGSSTPDRAARTTSPSSATFLPGAAGLCNAYGNGGLATTSTAYHSLEATAGGADRIDAYCADVAEQDGKTKKTKPTSGSSPSEEGSPPAAPSNRTPPGQSNKRTKNTAASSNTHPQHTSSQSSIDRGQGLTAGRPTPAAP